MRSGKEERATVPAQPALLSGPRVAAPVPAAAVVVAGAVAPGRDKGSSLPPRKAAAAGSRRAQRGRGGSGAGLVARCGGERQRRPRRHRRR